jgi:hypothetical protein
LLVFKFEKGVAMVLITGIKYDYVQDNIVVAWKGGTIPAQLPGVSSILLIPQF